MSSVPPFGNQTNCFMPSYDETDEFFPPSYDVRDDLLQCLDPDNKIDWPYPPNISWLNNPFALTDSIDFVDLEDPPLLRLQQIFQKITTGNGLNSDDTGFLDTSSKFDYSPSEKLSSSVDTTDDDISIGKINDLADKILNRKIRGVDRLSQVHQILDSKTNITNTETAALARLIQYCLISDGSFDTVLENLKTDKKRNPTRGELIDLVTNFNRTMLPRISDDGVNFLKIPIYPENDTHERSLLVRYNSQNSLEIIDGPVAPLDISCRQILTSTQETQILELYKTLSNNTHYNNLGELLEFVNYFANEKKTNLHLTLKKAFDSYKPDLIGIFDKYKSGTCILLSTKFRHELEKMGIQAESIAKPSSNTWSTIPIPGTEENPIHWLNFSEEISGANHTDTICYFKNAIGIDELISFACSFNQFNKDEIQEYFGSHIDSAMLEYLRKNWGLSSEQRPNRIIDPETIGKARLKGRFKAIMMKDKMTLGIDFLRGNFYINKSWATTIAGIPLNSQGMASINLDDLAKPDEKSIYYIDGHENTLSHREALQIILGKARSELFIPNDVEENIIALAQNSKAFFDELFVQPLPFIKAHYQELDEICEQIQVLKEITENEDVFLSDTPLQMKYLNYNIKYNEVIDLICKNNFELADEKIKELKLALVQDKVFEQINFIIQV